MFKILSTALLALATTSIPLQAEPTVVVSLASIGGRIRAHRCGHLCKQGHIAGRVDSNEHEVIL